MQVWNRAAEGAFEIFRIVGVPGELLVDSRRGDVFELGSGADTIEDVGIRIRGESRHGVRGIAGQGFGADRRTLRGRANLHAGQLVEGVDRGGDFLRSAGGRRLRTTARDGRGCGYGWG